MRGRGVYPLPEMVVAPLDRTCLRSRRRLQRALRRRSVLLLRARLIDGLNWLWRGAREPPRGGDSRGEGHVATHCAVSAPGRGADGGTSQSLQPAAHLAALKGLESAARVHERRLRAVAAGDPVQDAELGPYGSSGQYEKIVPERLALPAGGVAGSVPLMACLPPAWRETYGDVTNLLRDEGDVQPGRRRRVAHGCHSDAEYAALSVRLAAAGMTEFHEEEPAVVNGLFAVPKRDPGVTDPALQRQRLIGNMVPTNEHFLKPVGCPMPHVGVLADADVGFPSYSSKTDLETYYYRFAVPESWRRWFGLPPVWSDEVAQPGPRRLLYPCFRVLVMGWSHSVVLAQVAHLYTLYGAGGLDHRLSVSYPIHLLGVRTVRGDGVSRMELVETGAVDWAWQPEAPPRPAQLVMIDDLGTTHARSVEEANQLLERACKECYAPAGLVVNEKKVEHAATGRAVEILGIEFCPDGGMQPAAPRLAQLVRDTQALLDRGRASYHELASLLGRWVWVHLLRRSLLSIWFHAYRMLHQVLVHRKGSRYRLWQAVREELWAAICLAPLVRAQRNLPLDCTVVASDASSYGSGVVYTQLSEEETRGLANCREVKGWRTLCVGPGEASVERTGEQEHQTLAAARWRVAVRHRWVDATAHINEKEIRAAVQGLEWGLRAQRRWGRRHVRLVDNSAVVGALVKGRSSSYRLNTWCRRAAALGCASNTRYHWVYVRSERNPADAPSRGRWVRDLTQDGDVEANPGPTGRQTLLESTVLPSTLRAYHRALGVYLTWAEPYGVVPPGESEGVFCEWIVSVFEEQEGKGRSMCMRALCGLQLYYPSQVQEWREARRLLYGWARRVQTQSPNPVPWTLLYLVTQILRWRGEATAAAVCVVTFQQYLRIGEAFKLRVGEVALRGDRRLGQRGLGALLLRDPKTAKGSAQAVVVQHPLSLEILSRLCAGRGHAEPLFGSLTYSQFSRSWHGAWAMLGLRGMFPPYSMRHGGATHDYLQDVPLTDIQKRGRWRQFKSVDHYVGLHRALAVQVPQWVWRMAEVFPPEEWRLHWDAGDKDG